MEKKQKKTSYAHLFRLSHWLLGAGMLLLIFTGYAVHSVSMPAWSVIDRYPSFFPALRMIFWHKIIGIIFAPALIIGLILFLRKIKKIELSNLRRIATILLLVSGLLCVITGLFLIYSNIPAWIYHTSRFIHAISGMIIAPIGIIIHIYLALTTYLPLLVQSFAPFRQSRWSHVVWLLIGLVISWIVYTRFINVNTGMDVVMALKIDESVAEAKEMDSLPWDSAEPLTAKLYNGVGFEFGATSASIKALHNNEYIFMKIQWKDNVYNRIYRPWIKTETGWMRLNPGGSDEQIYNEDKLAVLFPINKDEEFSRYGCAVYCHNNKQFAHGHHWTAKDNPLDVWHWKSVRTDPSGYVDDKYWQGEEVFNTNEARHGDPGAGGHDNNSVTDVNHPIMLPLSLDSIKMGALLLSKSEIYTKTAAERFAVGSEVPGVIIADLDGDRADVKCYSSYKDNMWTLWIMRKLDTGSPYDVKFELGNKYDFAVAAFDHCSMRHSYNHQVYSLYIEE
jgi:hypothetical protein